jgi:hypothetical protein
MSTMSNMKQNEDPCLEHRFHSSKSTQICVKHDYRFRVQHIYYSI